MFVKVVFTAFDVDAQNVWYLMYGRESSTAATNNGAEGRKIGDILLTNMTVLQVSHLICAEIDAMFLSVIIL